MSQYYGSFNLIGDPYVGETIKLDEQSISELNAFLADKFDVSVQWQQKLVDNKRIAEIGDAITLTDNTVDSVGFLLTNDRDGVITGTKKDFYLLLSYSDTQGGSLVELQSSSILISNGNAPSATTSQIEGAPLQGETLSAEHLVVSDASGVPANAEYDYQWYRNGNKISGALDSTYTLSKLDVGTEISVKVTFYDSLDFFETLEVVVPEFIKADPVESVVVDGFYEQNAQVEAFPTFKTGSGDETLNYQWYRNEVAIEGATAKQYTLTQADVSQQISVGVTYQLGDYTTSPKYGSTTAIENRNDLPSGALLVTGQYYENEELKETLTPTYVDTVNGKKLDTWVFIDDTKLNVENANPIRDQFYLTVGAVLMANTANLADLDGLGTDFTYQWLRDGEVIENATSESYQVSSEDLYSVISLQLQYTDGFNTQEEVVSQPFFIEGGAEKEIRSSISIQSLNTGFDGLTVSKLLLNAHNSPLTTTGDPFSYAVNTDTSMTFSAGVGFESLQAVSSSDANDTQIEVNQKFIAGMPSDNSSLSNLLTKLQPIIDSKVELFGYVKLGYDEAQASNQPASIMLKSEVNSLQKGLIVDATNLPDASELIFDQAAVVVLSSLSDTNTNIQLKGSTDLYVDQGNQQVTATDGEFLLVMGNGNKDINLASGNDMVFLGSGNSYIDGGAGLDSLVLNGNKADYDLIVNGNGEGSLADLISAYQLQGVEMLYFEDGVKTVSDNPWMDQLLQDTWVI